MKHNVRSTYPCRVIHYSKEIDKKVKRGKMTVWHVADDALAIQIFKRTHKDVNIDKIIKAWS